VGKKLTTEEFIAKARQVHGDKYDYSLVNYKNSETKVKIGCGEHGTFEQTPNKHVSARTGCPNCAGNIRDSVEEFITKARAVHGDKYDYSKSNYVNSKTKITILCPDHGEFRQSPGVHYRCGCPTCGINTSGGQAHSLPQFIANAKVVHGERYDYSKVVYINSALKVKIVCNIHGIFEQSPDRHIHGKCDCPLCDRQNRTPSREEFITKARVVHGNKYDYSNINYTHSQTKITITCGDHGNFEQTPSIHLRGSGCPLCGEQQRTVSLDDFISRANNTHNNKYDYSLVVYKNTHTKVKIICPTHGEFMQQPVKHISDKNGCPDCIPRTYSNKCIEWLETIIESENIYIQHAVNVGEFKIIGTNNYHADGYCAETNTIYEFHGDAWHGNPDVYNPGDMCYPKDKSLTAGELYQKTIERENKIKSLGFNLIVMWENDWNKLRSK
jgi:hypothetical protein